MSTSRPVVVLQLPARLTEVQAREFMPEVESLLEADRPRLVFDFSSVRVIDSAGVDMLLQCLETAMKRDGDLKIAALTREAAVILELTRIGRLFETFETASDAVESFHGFATPSTAYSTQPWYTPTAPANMPVSDERIAG